MAREGWGPSASISDESRTRFRSVKCFPLTLCMIRKRWVRWLTKKPVHHWPDFSWRLPVLPHSKSTICTWHNYGWVLRCSCWADIRSKLSTEEIIECLSEWSTEYNFLKKTNIRPYILSNQVPEAASDQYYTYRWTMLFVSERQQDLSSHISSPLI